MICRFCGKKTNTTEKCDCCSKESPILLEYRSYENSSVIEKLSSVLEISDKDITEESVESAYDSEDVSGADSSETFQEESVSDSADEIEGITEDVVKKQNVKKIRPAVIIGCVIVLIGILIYTSSGNKNPTEESEMPSESQSAETTTALSTATELTSDTTSTEAQTTTAVATTTEIVDNTSFEGHYYSIDSSVFSDESSSNFVNVFGIKPVSCSKEIYLNSDSIDYNNCSYDVSIEDNVIALKYSDFAGIGEDFIDLFNFNEITQSDEHCNDENTQNVLYAFNINRQKVNFTVLGVKLNDLYYGGTSKKYNITDGLCMFSISNNGKDSVLWIEKDENGKGKISIKSSYRNSYYDWENSSGDIIKLNDRYEIARLSLDGEKSIYFYHELESQDVYMIQYIKYNTENNGISDAVLRE
ncbi:MAG: hypothetical protein NC548_43135 [Lachnospiraceae bacterium]|nr:hypothetical protein [Lachnospiraceae bacterium]MCM1230902.1 hypothetical protein [Ruminococcus flavefaciens]